MRLIAHSTWFGYTMWLKQSFFWCVCALFPFRPSVHRAADRVKECEQRSKATTASSAGKTPQDSTQPNSSCLNNSAINLFSHFEFFFGARWHFTDAKKNHRLFLLHCAWIRLFFFLLWSFDAISNVNIFSERAN